MEFQHAIDLSGLRCPLPVLRTKKALSQLPSGAVLRVRATDDDSQNDIPAFVKQAGHELLSQDKSDEGFCFYIQKR